MNAEAENSPEDAGTEEPRPVRLELPVGGPDAENQQRLRVLLMHLRSELARSSKDLADEALKGSGQNFKIDHMADFASDNFEQEMSLSLLEGESELLYEIEKAVRKIDGVGDVPYGICEACVRDGWEGVPGGPWIPTGRLEAVPYARLCVPHQEEQEEG